MPRYVKQFTIFMAVPICLFGGFLLWAWHDFPIPKAYARYVGARYYIPSSGPGRWKYVLGSKVSQLRAGKAEYLAARTLRIGCQKNLAEFLLTGQFAACGYADDREWFLHFTADGEIKYRIPDSLISELRYQKMEGGVAVDLSDIFQGDPLYRRAGATRLEIENDGAIHKFRLSYYQEAVVPQNACVGINFEELGGSKRRFQLWFYDQERYRLEF